MPDSTRAQAHLFMPKQQSIPAQMRHRHRKADARAQAGFFKDHRQRFAGQDRRVLSDRLVLPLETDRHIQHVPKLRGCGLGKGNEVFHQSKTGYPPVQKK
jgi:hypothetical protein